MNRNRIKISAAIFRMFQMNKYIKEKQIIEGYIEKN